MNIKSYINKDKGVWTQAYGNGEIFSIVSLISNFLLLQCFTMAQYIALEWEMEDRIKTFSSYGRTRIKVFVT